MRNITWFMPFGVKYLYGTHSRYDILCEELVGIVGNSNE